MQMTLVSTFVQLCRVKYCISIGRHFQTRAAAADITGFAHISLRLCQFPPSSLPLQVPPTPPLPPSPGGLICPLLRNTQYTGVYSTSTITSTLF